MSEPTTTTEPRCGRVLILDDDPAMLRLLTDYLQGPHLELVTCSEIEAAECLLEHLPFDVLISDLEVSDLGGLEGMRLIRYATCHFPDTRVIVFSGRLDEDVRKLARALGAAAVLSKPADLARVRELVDQAPVDRRERMARKAGQGEVSRVQTLDEVLRGRGISAVLQPIVSIGEIHLRRQPFGVEGLARGPAESVLRNPEILLGYASRKARLFETELQCIEAVLREASALPDDGKLFINVRPRSLSAANAAARLSELVQRAGRRESQVVLELTEQQTILNPRAFNSALCALRECGFDIALDDYGRGFANLHLVQELKPDYLKIDGFFCHEIHLDPRKQALVRSTVEMARGLGISTIMEHVESQAELEVVRDLGVSHAQGYHFSEPVPGDDLVDWFGSPELVANIASFRNTGEEHSTLPARRAALSRRRSALHELNNLLIAVTLHAMQATKTLSPDDPLRPEFEQIGRAAELAVAEARKLDEKTACAQSDSLGDVA